jgi:hypothetical protein
MAATIASAAQSIVSSLAAAIRRALPRSFAAAAAILLMAFASLFFSCGKQASAADASPQLRAWVVGELRGAAFSRPGAAFSRPGAADDAQWQPLQTGARIAPGSVVRTDASGSMELKNGIDTIRLSPASEIELPAGQNGDPVTRVIHWIGTAFFHIGKRPGPQFEVDTPYIVAIVKGTKFTTAVSEAGASIKVSEGIVGVSATSGGSSIDVTAGEGASVSASDSGTVSRGGQFVESAVFGNGGGLGGAHGGGDGGDNDGGGHGHGCHGDGGCHHDDDNHGHDHGGHGH